MSDVHLDQPIKPDAKWLPVVVRGATVLVFALAPCDAFATDEWSTEQQRAVWRESLEAESLGNASSGVLFNEAGSVAGLHGDFPVPNFKVSSIQNWIYAHRQMLGLLPSELVDADEKLPFFEALPDGPDNVVNAQTGTVYLFSVVLGGAKAGHGTFKVIADKRTGTIRGLYSSHEPTTQGFSDPDACSTRSRPPIPREADHRFHGKPITRSTGSRSPEGASLSG